MFVKADGLRATEMACKFWWKSLIRSCHLAVGAVVYRNQVVIAPNEESVVWSLQEGSVLPTGVYLTTSGMLEGTPTQAGNYIFTVVLKASIKNGGSQHEHMR